MNWRFSHAFEGFFSGFIPTWRRPIFSEGGLLVGIYVTELNSETYVQADKTAFVLLLGQLVDALNDIRLHQGRDLLAARIRIIDPITTA